MEGVIAGSGSRRETIEGLFRLVDVDTKLAVHVRRCAGRLRPLLNDNAEVAYERLCDLAAQVADALPRTPPTEQLAKCVGLGSFHLYYLDEDVRAFYPTVEGYRRFLDAHPLPERQLMQDLKRGEVLIPARHSWLVEATRVAGMDAREVVTALALDVQPPLVRLELDVARMQAAGVTVRPARAVDAVRGQHLRWDPTGLPRGWPEYLDGDVPASAVARIRWLP